MVTDESGTKRPGNLWNASERAVERKLINVFLRWKRPVLVAEIRQLLNLGSADESVDVVKVIACPFREAV
jgi:hypothetical protein